MADLPQIQVIHGPNLNLLGTREPGVYGALTLDTINERISARAAELGLSVRFFQSNHEGAIIDTIHAARETADAIIINPGAYTHYAYAIADALRSVSVPAIEVHLSNVHAREEFRHRSVTAPATVGQVVGFGVHSYLLALEAARAILQEKKSKESNS